MRNNDKSYPSHARACVALGTLMVVTFTALLDRYLIALLLQPIRAQFSITDTQVSLLQGVAFAFFYAVLGVPFGRLVDRHNRRNLIIGGILLWSAMTVACGLAQNYWQLFFARLGIGIGEACLAPAAYSLITDLFPPRWHGRGLAFFSLSSVVGGGGSFIVGAAAVGLATQVHVHLPLFGVLEPWRLTFLLVGLPGLIVAVPMLAIREPVRHGDASTERQASLGELRQFLGSIGKPLGALVVANSAMSIVGTGVTAWVAVFLARTYAIPTAEGGRWIGLILILSGTAGGIIAGWAADSSFVVRLKGQKLVVGVIACLAGIPFTLFPLAPTAGAALLIYFLFGLAFNVYACSAPSILQDLLPNRFKGQVTALYLLCTGLIGFGLGSTTVALVTDHVFADEAKLRYSLIVVAVPSLLISAVCILFCRPSYQALRDRMVSDTARLAAEEQRLAFRVVSRPHG